MNVHPKDVPGHRAAFTLLELLVTIAILIVLSALSLAGIRSLMQAARAATCVNNMKQIAVTHVTLAVENGGYLVHPWTSVIGESEQRNWSEFHTILLSDDFAWDQPESDVSERLRTMHQFRCPSAYALRKSEMKKLTSHRGWRTYGLNQKIGVNLDENPAERAWTDGAKTVGEVMAPEKLVLLAEKMWDGSKYPGAISPQPRPPYADFHRGGFHVAYFDGHVEKHTKDSFLLDGKTLPNGQVGDWSNPEFSLMWRGRLTRRPTED